MNERDTQVSVNVARAGPIKVVTVSAMSGPIASVFSLSEDEAQRLADDLTKAIRMPLADTPEKQRT